jgi:ATP-dependent Clp protease ATP-binding subunit ClpA
MPVAQLAAHVRILASMTPGRSLSELEQLRAASTRAQVDIDRPRQLINLLRPSRSSDWDSRSHLDQAAILAHLARDVVGQPYAIAEIARVITNGREGDPIESPTAMNRRPRAGLLLTGPSGTGKTEAGRSLARAFFGSEEHIVRVDCSTLTQAHDVASLTGARPGYIGSDAMVALHGRVRAQPAIVVVFDEVDKCHPLVLDQLLSILEEGELPDGSGTPTSFSDCVVLLTSNFGANELEQGIASGRLDTPAAVIAASEQAAEFLLTAPQSEGGKGKKALWSRLGSRAIGFDVLRRDALSGIVDKLARNAETNYRDKQGREVHVDRPSFVAALDRLLPTDGAWDGRKVKDEMLPLVIDAFDRAVDQQPEGALRLVALLPPAGVTPLRRHTA